VEIDSRHPSGVAPRFGEKSVQPCTMHKRGAAINVTSDALGREQFCGNVSLCLLLTLLLLLLRIYQHVNNKLTRVTPIERYTFSHTKIIFAGTHRRSVFSRRKACTECLCSVATSTLPPAQCA